MASTESATNGEKARDAALTVASVAYQGADLGLQIAADVKEANGTPALDVPLPPAAILWPQDNPTEQAVVGVTQLASLGYDAVSSYVQQTGDSQNSEPSQDMTGFSTLMASKVTDPLSSYWRFNAAMNAPLLWDRDPASERPGFFALRMGYAGAAALKLLSLPAESMTPRTAWAAGETPWPEKVEWAGSAEEVEEFQDEYSNAVDYGATYDDPDAGSDTDGDALPDYAAMTSGLWALDRYAQAFYLGSQLNTWSLYFQSTKPANGSSGALPPVLSYLGAGGIVAGQFGTMHAAGQKPDAIAVASNLATPVVAGLQTALVDDPHIARTNAKLNLLLAHNLFSDAQTMMTYANANDESGILPMFNTGMRVGSGLLNAQAGLGAGVAFGEGGTEAEMGTVGVTLGAAELVSLGNSFRLSSQGYEGVWGPYLVNTGILAGSAVIGGLAHESKLVQFLANHVSVGVGPNGASASVHFGQ